MSETVLPCTSTRVDCNALHRHDRIEGDNVHIDDDMQWLEHSVNIHDRARGGAKTWLH